MLSRYYGRSDKLPIYIVDSTLGQAVPVDAYSKVYERYRQPTRLTRLYCTPDRITEARALIKKALTSTLLESGAAK